MLDNIPPRPNQVFCLDLASAHLSSLRILLDLDDKLLLLVLELYSFTIQLSLRFLESALVFAETLGGRHAFAEGPFYNLVVTGQYIEIYRSGRAEGKVNKWLEWCKGTMTTAGKLTFMVEEE